MWLGSLEATGIRLLKFRDEILIPFNEKRGSFSGVADNRDVKKTEEQKMSNIDIINQYG